MVHGRRNGEFIYFRNWYGKILYLFLSLCFAMDWGIGLRRRRWWWWCSCEKASFGRNSILRTVKIWFCVLGFWFCHVWALYTLHFWKLDTCRWQSWFDNFRNGVGLLMPWACWLCWARISQLYQIVFFFFFFFFVEKLRKLNRRMCVLLFFNTRLDLNPLYLYGWK